MSNLLANSVSFSLWHFTLMDSWLCIVTPLRLWYSGQFFKCDPFPKIWKDFTTKASCYPLFSWLFVKDLVPRKCLCKFTSGTSNFVCNKVTPSSPILVVLLHRSPFLPPFLKAKHTNAYNANKLCLPFILILPCMRLQSLTISWHQPATPPHVFPADFVFQHVQSVTTKLSILSIHANPCALLAHFLPSNSTCRHCLGVPTSACL